MLRKSRFGREIRESEENQEAPADKDCKRALPGESAGKCGTDARSPFLENPTNLSGRKATETAFRLFWKTGLFTRFQGTTSKMTLKFDAEKSRPF